MEITVLGWYGTETIGDRAILAGTLSIVSESTTEIINIRLGSLFPVLSHRTKVEDIHFLKEITNGNLGDFRIFNSLDSQELEDNISKSDWVIMGGGPLMDIDELYMILYAFKYAKKKGIKRILFGCGWETLSSYKYIKCAKELVRLSNLVVFRDSTSVENMMRNFGKDEIERPLGLLDPAFFAAQYYRKKYDVEKGDEYVAMNLRQLYVDNNNSKDNFSIANCVTLISKLLNYKNNGEVMPIRLIPMHTFFWGGDDRIILNKVAQIVNNPNVIVQNDPLSLKETMKVYRNAYSCIGMRFHSVVLQTILNGKNYILDYTDPQHGKIVNMINQLGLRNQLNGRYVTPSNIENLILKPDIEQLCVDDTALDLYKEQYINSIKNII